MRSLLQGRLPAIRWSGVVAGALAALAVHVTLGLFVSAMGSLAERFDSGALGFLSGLLGLLVPFVASAAGAWLAIRLSGLTHSAGAVCHGLLVWAIGLVAGAVFLTGTGLSALGEVRAADAGLEARDERAGEAAGALALAGLAAAVGALGGWWGASMARRSLLGAAAIALKESAPLQRTPARVREARRPGSGLEQHDRPH